jgi:hypothetical protein
MIGLDYTIQLNGTQQGSQKSGLLPGFMNTVHGYSFPAGSPWSGVTFAQWPTRILGPNAVQYSPGGNPSLIGFVSSGVAGEFLDPAIQTAWDNWKAPNCMKIVYNASLNGFNPANTPVWGQVDSNENFVFYNPSVITSCAQIASNPSLASNNKVTTLPSPFNQSYWTSTNQMNACTTATSWLTATSSVLLQNGPFVAPGTLKTCTGGILGTVSFPENTTYPDLSAAIGNIVSTAINRGLFNSATTADQTQPECPGISSLYANSVPYLNYYGAALWYAVHQGLTPKNGQGQPSGVYGIPYDDQCGYSSDLADSAAQSIIVTINGN